MNISIWLPGTIAGVPSLLQRANDSCLLVPVARLADSVIPACTYLGLSVKPTVNSPIVVTASIENPVAPARSVIEVNVQAVQVSRVVMVVVAAPLK